MNEPEYVPVDEVLKVIDKMAEKNLISKGAAIELTERILMINTPSKYKTVSYKFSNSKKFTFD